MPAVAAKLGKSRSVARCQYPFAWNCHKCLQLLTYIVTHSSRNHSPSSSASSWPAVSMRSCIPCLVCNTICTLRYKRCVAMVSVPLEYNEYSTTCSHSRKWSNMEAELLLLWHDEMHFCQAACVLQRTSHAWRGIGASCTMLAAAWPTCLLFTLRCVLVSSRASRVRSPPAFDLNRTVPWRRCINKSGFLTLIRKTLHFTLLGQHELLSRSASR